LTTSTTRFSRFRYLGHMWQCFDLFFGKKTDGKRVVICRNQHGSCEIKAIRGDGRKPNFKMYELVEVHLVGLDWQERAAEVARAMADRHF